jgi:hypothetical protein
MAKFFHFRFPPGIPCPQAQETQHLCGLCLNRHQNQSDQKKFLLKTATSVLCFVYNSVRVKTGPAKNSEE